MRHPLDVNNGSNSNHILIVDDDIAICESLRDILEYEKYQVSSCLSGAEAIEIVRNNNIEVVIIDIKLPDTDGILLLEEIKKISREIICIIVTGNASVKNAVEALKFDAEDYFIKPFVAEDIIHRTKKALERKSLQYQSRENEELYRSLMKTSPDSIIITNATGEIFESSFKTLGLYGFEKVEDLRGKNILEMISEKDRELAKNNFERTITEGFVLESEYNFKKCDGNTFIGELRASSIKNVFGEGTALIHIIRDITERWNAEKVASQNLARIHTVLNQIIYAIAYIVETRDPYTAGHQRRVSRLSQAISRELNLQESHIDWIGLASFVHDIGKIVVPAEILSKPGELSEGEYSIIRKHPKVGYNVLKNIDFPWPIAKVVLQHHEKMDGSGYPAGLREEEIIPEARIIAVADVVEAMSSHRPYRPAFGIDSALKEISQQKKVLYDEDVVEACLTLFREKKFSL